MARHLNHFGHEGEGGSLPQDRVRAAGYRYSMLGENLGVGKRTAREIVEAWLLSDGHCHVLMQPGFTEIGVGMASGPWDTEGPPGVIEAPYWTSDFGLPKTSEPDAGPNTASDAGADDTSDASAASAGDAGLARDE
jgi:uncharacterized protein YkwD